MPGRPKLQFCKYGHDIAVVGRTGSCCKECSRLKSRSYYKTNKRKVLSQSLQHKRLTRYGLTDQEYIVLLERQGNRCAICFDAPTTRQLHIDHCHTTGKIRGLLCSKCNVMLGMARDNKLILQAGIEYLNL